VRQPPQKAKSLVAHRPRLKERLTEALKERDAASKAALDLMIVLQNVVDGMDSCVRDARTQMAKIKRGEA
jgi:hypothetical protein